MGIFKAIKAIAVLLTIGIIVGSIYYISNLQANLATAKANSEILKESIEEQTAVITEMEENSKFQQEAFAEASKRLQDQYEQLQDLQSKFDRSSNGNPRDFGFIASQKPKLIERLVNKGTKDMNRCFEIVTGSPLTEKELKADKRSLINTSCPELANPNYIKVTP
jgi:hypothetical protein